MATRLASDADGFRAAGAFYTMAVAIAAASAPLLLYHGPQRPADAEPPAATEQAAASTPSSARGRGRVAALSAEAWLVAWSALLLLLYVGVEVSRSL